jgi:hypothetical protein
MLGDVGLVHMNGRVYDPLIARFGTPADRRLATRLQLQSPALEARLADTRRLRGTPAVDEDLEGRSVAAFNDDRIPVPTG